MPEYPCRGAGLPQRGGGRDQRVIGGPWQSHERGARASVPERVASLPVTPLGDQALDGGAEGREVNGAAAPAVEGRLPWELRPWLERLGFHRARGDGVGRCSGRGFGGGAVVEWEAAEGSELQLH